MRQIFLRLDILFIEFLKRVSIPFSRFAIFVVFFWFGILKIVGTSPANPMVSDLLNSTLPFISFDTFIVSFSIYEMIIGITFLIPRCERLAVALLIPHMAMTALPLVFLSDMTWQGFMTPTLEGQYIIKNLVIIALAVGISAHITPMVHKYKNI